MSNSRPGDVIFVSGKGLISRIIKFFDKGRFSHVAMIVSNTDSNGNFSVIESQYGLNTVIRKCNYNPKNYEIVSLGLTDEQREKIISLAIETINHYDSYDYKQLLYQGWMDFLGLHGRNKWNSPTHPICSETMVYILNRLKWFKNKSQIKYLTDATPNELYKILKYQLKND